MTDFIGANFFYGTFWGNYERECIKTIKNQTQIMDLYKTMLPDLVHKKNRFYKYANEQANFVHHLLD